MRDNQKKESRVMEHHDNGNQAEERLREYERVVEGLEEMIAVIDRDYRYLIANRAFLNQRGLKRETVVGHLVSEVLDKDLFERVVKPKLEECFQGKVVRYEMDYSHPEIGARVLSISYLPIEGPHGVDRVACVLQDITEWRQAEELLRQSERQLAEAQHTAHVGSWNCDMQSNILTWSNELYDIYGLKQQEFKPNYAAFLELAHPEDRDFIAKSVEDCLLNHEPFSREERIIRPDGEERIVHSSGNVVCDDKGNPIRMYGTCQDVTERKHAEAALRQAEEKYRDIFENAGEGISQTTPEGRFIAANPALTRMYGFDSPAELISSIRDISRQVYVDPARREEFKSLLEEHGVVRGFEYQIFRKDGSKTWVSVNARAVHDAQGATLYYEGTTQDINERKRAQARSAAFATLARKLSGARTQLDAGRIITQTAGDLFGWDSCDLNHYDADRDLVYQMLNIDIIDGQQTEVFGVISGRKPSARGRRVIDHGPELLLREEPVQFDADAIPFGDRTRPSASIMTVPIRHADRVIGLLSIQSYTRHCYDAAALDDLQALADHCGEAMNRIRAEQALFESEERFRQMADQFEDVLWITDRGIRQALYVNPAYEKAFGRSRESVYERVDSFVEVVHPDDRDAIQGLLARQREGAHEALEYRIVKPDGSVRWMMRRSFPIRNNDGEVYRVAGIIQDITERKRAESEREVISEVIQSVSLTSNLDELLTHVHQSLKRVLYAENCCVALFSKQIGLFEGPLFVDLVETNPFPMALSKNCIAKVFSNGQPLLMNEAIFAEMLERGEVELIGRPSPSFLAVPLMTPTETIGVIVVQHYEKDNVYSQRDVEFLSAVAAQLALAIERKRAEAALQESEERFRQLSEAPFEAIILHDRGMILEVNQSFCRMYGYEAAEVIGKSVLDLTLPRFREALQQRVQSGSAGSFDGLALRKDGTIFRAELAAKPIHYQGRAVRVAAIRDITEQKRNERRQAAQYAVTRVLAESATLAEATTQLLQVICESLGWKMGEFWRVCDRPNVLRCAETWHAPALEATSFIEASRQIELAPGVDLPGRVWQSGQPAWIRDVMKDPCFVRAEIAARVGLRGAVAFPILMGNHTLGVMLFFSRRDPEVDADLLKIMSAIGSQIGQFIERKRAEEALRESEERYRDLVENSREFICTHDLHGVILSANREAVEVLGYDPKDYAGKKSFRDLLVPEVRDQFDDYLARIRHDGFASGLTVVQTSSGKRRVWEYYNTLRTEGVAAPIVRGMARDITERREAEKALRVSEQRYRDIFSFAPLGICQSLPDGTLITANKALATMLGYDSVDELLQLQLDNDVYFVPGQRQELISTYEPRGYAVDLEFQFKRKDGSPFWVQMDAHAVRGPGGVTEYFEAFVRDITERKRSEESLRKQNEYLAALHETALGLLNRLDLKELLEVIVARACALVDIPSGYVYLLEPGGNEMSVKVGVGVSRDFVGGLISKGQGVAGRVWETGQPLVVEDYRNWGHRLTNAGYDNLRLVGAVPLRSGSRVVGVLGVESTKEGQGLDQHQIEILNRFGQLASIALDNAQLHSAAQQELVERKRTEEEVSNLRGELELTMNSMEEGIHRVDMKGNIAFENPAAARMLGWEVSELLGKPAHLTMHHTKQDGTPYPNEECPICATCRDGVSRHVTNEVFWRRDGMSIPVEYKTAPMRNDRDEIVATVVTFRDITERKRAEEEKKITFHQLGERVKELGALHLAAQIFQDTQKTTSDVLEEIASILPAAWQYPDISAARVTYGGAESTTPNYSDTLWKQSAAFATKDGKQGAIEVGYLEERPNEVEGPFLAEERDLINTLAYDLAVFLERKHAEKSLSESEERYRELFENARDAIYVHDLSGRYTSVNRAAEQLVGFSREQILGKHFSNFVSPRDLKEVRTNLCRKLDDENETVYEVNVVTRAGQRVPVEISSRLIYENGVAVGIQGTARDITDRRRAQEALRMYSQRLIQAQEAEREKIARELHDQIGQVLTAVRINLQSIQRSYGSDENIPRFDESIAIVDEALGSVRELSIELRPSLLDDLGLTAALRWYVDHYSQRTGITAEVLNGSKEDGRLPRELETACFRIAQEALTNVARHAQASSVSVQLQRSREKMWLTVIDDGVGFDIDDLRQNMQTASALGLRGMEERALAVGGFIKIDSGLGRGTRVHATFPLRQR